MHPGCREFKLWWTWSWASADLELQRRVCWWPLWIYKYRFQCFCDCGYTDLNWCLMILEYSALLPSITFSLLLRWRPKKRWESCWTLWRWWSESESHVGGEGRGETSSMASEVCVDKGSIQWITLKTEWVVSHYLFLSYYGDLQTWFIMTGSFKRWVSTERLGFQCIAPSH